MITRVSIITVHSINLRGVLALLALGLSMLTPLRALAASDWNEGAWSISLGWRDSGLGVEPGASFGEVSYDAGTTVAGGYHMLLENGWSITLGVGLFETDGFASQPSVQRSGFAELADVKLDLLEVSLLGGRRFALVDERVFFQIAAGGYWGMASSKNRTVTFDVASQDAQIQLSDDRFLMGGAEFAADLVVYGGRYDALAFFGGVRGRLPFSDDLETGFDVTALVGLRLDTGLRLDRRSRP